MTPVTSTSIDEILADLTDLPTPVHSWLTEVGEDSTGKPAVWVWAILPDWTEEDWPDVDTRARLRERIRTAIMQHLSDRVHWVYVHFRGASEVIDE